MCERHRAAGDRPVSRSRIAAFWHCTRGNKRSAGLLPPAEICGTAAKMLGNQAGEPALDFTIWTFQPGSPVVSGILLFAPLHKVNMPSDFQLFSGSTSVSHWDKLMTHLLTSFRLDAWKMSTILAQRPKPEGSKPVSLTAPEFCHHPTGKNTLTVPRLVSVTSATFGFHTYMCLMSGLRITSSIEVRTK